LNKDYFDTINQTQFRFYTKISNSYFSFNEILLVIWIN